MMRQDVKNKGEKFLFHYCWYRWLVSLVILAIKTSLLKLCFLNIDVDGHAGFIFRGKGYRDFVTSF